MVESGSTINSSFAFNINSGQKTYNLYAAITSKSFNPSSTTFSPPPLKITLRSITGVSTTGGVTGAIQLVEYPPSSNTLATNATKTGSSATAVWTYDLTLSPIGYTIPPGTYTYTVTVQYSDGATSINRTFNITISVQSVVSLAFTQNSTPNFDFSSASAYSNGITMSNANTFTLKSNKNWIFTAAANTANFSNSGTYSTTMPASVLRLTVGSTQGNLSTSALQLNSGSATSGTTFNMSLFANPGYNYGPGIYTINISYTITAQ
ncbi:MAG: hypothetical protein ICV66_07050 [Chitinophagaceae bacterium]|nr:hypothetical protein [Chitinophagaceae bacterium]